MVTKRLLMLAMMSVAALVLSVGPVQADMSDLTTLNSSDWISGAFFTTTDNASTGTGLIRVVSSDSGQGG